MWISGLFHRNVIEDETDFLQLGQEDEYTFHTYTTYPPQPTSWTDFPTEENPGSYYKYASFDLEIS